MRKREELILKDSRSDFCLEWPLSIAIRDILAIQKNDDSTITLLAGGLAILPGLKLWILVVHGPTRSSATTRVRRTDRQYDGAG